MTKTVALAEAEWPELFEEVRKHHHEVIVTHDGEPIAKVVPIPEPPRRRFRTLEELRQSGRVVGDIMEPLDDEWDVEK